MVLVGLRPRQPSRLLAYCQARPSATRRCRWKPGAGASGHGKASEARRTAPSKFMRCWAEGMTQRQAKLSSDTPSRPPKKAGQSAQHPKKLRRPKPPRQPEPRKHLERLPVASRQPTMQPSQVEPCRAELSRERAKPTSQPSLLRRSDPTDSPSREGARAWPCLREGQELCAVGRTLIRAPAPRPARARSGTRGPSIPCQRSGQRRQQNSAAQPTTGEAGARLKRQPRQS